MNNKFIVTLIVLLIAFNAASWYLLFNRSVIQPQEYTVLSPKNSGGGNKKSLQPSEQIPGYPISFSGQKPLNVSSSKSYPPTEICDGLDNNNDGKIDDAIDRDFDGKADGPCADTDYPGGKEAYFKFRNSIKK